MLDNNVKICSICKKSKELNQFNKVSGKNEKLKKQCKECLKKYCKQYYRKKQEYFQIYRKKYNEENHNLQIQRGRENYKNNREKCLLSSKKYHENNKEKIRKQRTKQKKERYYKDPIFKIQVNFRTRLNQFLKGNIKKCSISKLLGCSFEKVKQHLESQFLPEMNWSNHGTIWEIDHVIPLSSFNLLNEEEQVKCFHYTNLQPLFKTTSIAKSFGYNDQIGNRNKSSNI